MKMYTKNQLPTYLVSGGKEINGSRRNFLDDFVQHNLSFVLLSIIILSYWLSLAIVFFFHNIFSCFNRSFVYLSVRPLVCLSIRPSQYIFFFCLSFWPLVCLFVPPFVCSFICSSLYQQYIWKFPLWNEILYFVLLF